jgi:hypothetical protein
MSALFKRIGVGIIALDLLVGAGSAYALHKNSAAAAHEGKMSSARLEQVVEESSGAFDTSCSTDPTGGWDYYCISSDGSRTLYDVSAGRIVQQSALPSYR